MIFSGRPPRKRLNQKHTLDPPGRGLYSLGSTAPEPIGFRLGFLTPQTAKSGGLGCTRAPSLSELGEGGGRGGTPRWQMAERAYGGAQLAAKSWGNPAG